MLRSDSRKRRLQPKLSSSLLQAARKVDHEAAQIYFGENSFILSPPSQIEQWKRRLWRRHLNMIRNVVVELWDSVPYRYDFYSASRPYNPKYDADFRKIGGLKSIQSLTILVDEKRFWKRWFTHPLSLNGTVVWVTDLRSR
jgi:hypothetical protein